MRRALHVLRKPRLFRLGDSICASWTEEDHSKASSTMRMNWATCEPRPSRPHLGHLLQFFSSTQGSSRRKPPLSAFVRHPIKEPQQTPSPHQIPSICLDLGSEVNSHSSDDQESQRQPTEAVCPEAAQALLTLGFLTPNPRKGSETGCGCPRWVAHP